MFADVGGEQFQEYWQTHHIQFMELAESCFTRECGSEADHEAYTGLGELMGRFYNKIAESAMKGVLQSPHPSTIMINSTSSQEEGGLTRPGVALCIPTEGEQVRLSFDRAYKNSEAAPCLFKHGRLLQNVLLLPGTVSVIFAVSVSRLY
jgi:hypothetical protein